MSHATFRKKLVRFSFFAESRGDIAGVARRMAVVCGHLKDHSSSYTLEALPKVNGLINLGNFCYLNSVLQCLSQCHYLTHHLNISSRYRRCRKDDGGGAARARAAPAVCLWRAECMSLLQMTQSTWPGDT